MEINKQLIWLLKYLCIDWPPKIKYSNVGITFNQISRTLSRKCIGGFKEDESSCVLNVFCIPIYIYIINELCLIIIHTIFTGITIEIPAFKFVVS